MKPLVPLLLDRLRIREESFVVIRFATVLAAGMLLAVAAVAQPHDTSAPHTGRSEVNVQYNFFSNFFYSPRNSEDVSAWGAEYRGAYRWSESPAEVYTHLNALKYDRSGLENAYGGRLGLRSIGKVQSYNVFADIARNRPASDIRGAGTADRTTLYGSYAYRVRPSWELGGDLDHETQDISGQPQRNSTFNRLQGTVRYRGFGWRITPRAGLAAGHRSVRNGVESYDEKGWFAGVELIPIDVLWCQIGIKGQSRDYDSRSTRSGERHSYLELMGDYKLRPRVHLTVYYSGDKTNSPLPGEDLTAQILLVGAAWRF